MKKGWKELQGDGNGDRMMEMVIGCLERCCCVGNGDRVLEKVLLYWECYQRVGKGYQRCENMFMDVVREKESLERVLVYQKQCQDVGKGDRVLEMVLEIRKRVLEMLE